MVPVVLVVFQVPGPEIRILQEISSPEVAGNRRKTRLRPPKGLYRAVVGGSGGPPGGFWYWWSPGWVLVLVVLEGTKPREANPRVGSGTGFGGPGGGSGGPGGGFVVGVKVMGKPLLRL